MMNVLSYQHFPIYAIMVLFLGAFLIVLFGKNKIARSCLALLSVTGSLALLVSLVPRVMLNGEIITYWMGNRAYAGGYAIGIALEVDALSLFFALLVRSRSSSPASTPSAIWSMTTTSPSITPCS